MEQDRKPKASGLKWRTRKDGREIPYWVPNPKLARQHGYPTKTVRLEQYANDPAALLNRCAQLQLDFDALVGRPIESAPFDGTFASLIDRYVNDPESTYSALRPSSLVPYRLYVGLLRQHIGKLTIDGSDGLDLKAWFKAWAGNVKDARDPAAKLPRAHLVLCVLKAAVSFGVLCRLPGCKDFYAILQHSRFQSPKPRSHAPSAEQVKTLRLAAHARGFPERGLAYAMQYELTLRQWDVTGAWLPLSDPRPSAFIHGAWKWLGPTWEQIDKNLIFKATHMKTQGKASGKRLDASSTFDLKLCPMIREEMTFIPPEQRKGPLIVNPNTGLPYTYRQFLAGWRRDFKAAGLRETGLWNRDLRAGGITEGGKAAATVDDRRKVAGHASEHMTAEVYDRETLEAHRRVMKARVAWRSKGEENA